VERELLLARHLERDRMEVLKPGRAAEGATARPAAVEPLGLVADADLAQLDPGAEAGRQVLDQLAEVDPVLGREVERDAVPGEGDLDLRQVHLELAGLDALAAELERLALAAAVVVLLVEILLLGLADDLPGHVAGPLELDQRLVLEEDVAERLADVGLDDDAVAELEGDAAGVEEEVSAAAPQGDLDDVGHGRHLYGGPVGGPRERRPGAGESLLREPRRDPDTRTARVRLSLQPPELSGGRESRASITPRVGRCIPCRLRIRAVTAAPPEAPACACRT